MIDADALARDVLAPGTPGFDEVAARWRSVVSRDGVLDRAALGAIVFADAQARETLNAIVHPRVRAQSAALEAAAVPGSIVVHDVPLLFEGDYWQQCDRNVLVVAPREARIARVIAREGWTRAAIEARMEAQIDPKSARARADFTINNDEDIVTLEMRARTVFNALRAAAAR